jgi:hypothetical protein
VIHSSSTEVPSLRQKVRSFADGSVLEFSSWILVPANYASMAYGSDFKSSLYESS